MQKSMGLFLISVVCIAAILVTGCTSSGSSPAPVTTIATPAPTTAAVVVVTTTDAPVQTTVPASVVTTTTTAVAAPTVTLIQRDNPFLLNLKFTKNYFSGRIDNCPMQEAFPLIAKDPNYGISKTPPKITALSAQEYRVFLRDYTEGKNEGSKMVGVAKCEGAVVNPWWNFVEVSAKVTPTNVIPANYTATLNIRYQGKIIAQFNSTETLVKDQIIEYISYIPLTTNDMDFFDGIEITYNRLPN